MRDPPLHYSLLSVFKPSSTTSRVFCYPDPAFHTHSPPSQSSSRQKLKCKREYSLITEKECDNLETSNHNKLRSLSPDERIPENRLLISSHKTFQAFIFFIFFSSHFIPLYGAITRDGLSNIASNYRPDDKLQASSDKYSNDSFAQPTENVDTISSEENYASNINNSRENPNFSNSSSYSTKSNIGLAPTLNKFNNLTIMCSVPNKCSNNVYNNLTGFRNSAKVEFNSEEKLNNNANLYKLAKENGGVQNRQSDYVPTESSDSIKLTENMKTIREEQSSSIIKHVAYDKLLVADLIKTKHLTEEKKSLVRVIKNSDGKKNDAKAQVNKNHNKAYFLHSKEKRNRVSNNKSISNPVISSVFGLLKGQSIAGGDNETFVIAPPDRAPRGEEAEEGVAQREEDRKTFKRKSQQKGGGSSMRRVSVLGLFELSTRWGTRPEGQAELAAARLAVRHVNERRLLPGYYLHLLTNDTKCDPGVGVDRFFHALYTQTSTRMVMLLGSACSEVTESLAKVVPYWNIVQVSFGSTSPALSDRSEFPLFYRTVAPDSSHNPARIAFIRRFGWDTVTALSQNEEVYSLAVNDLVTELEQANITCAATITFAETDFKEQLKLLRELDTRIIIGSFSHEMAPKIFCEAYSLGMFGPDYAWILHGPPAPPWWRQSPACPPQHLAAATDNLILVSSHNSIVGEQMVSYSGLTNEMFTAEMSSVKAPLSRYAPQTYDAVWAIALALRGAEAAWGTRAPDTARRETLRKLLDLGKSPDVGPPEKARNTTGNKYTTPARNFKNQTPSTSVFSLGHFDYTRKDMAEEFLQQLGNLNFLGVSGPVSFSGADRVGTSAFYQVQEGEATPVALFSPGPARLDFECPMCRAVRWAGGQVPVARRVFMRRIETIAPAAFLVVTTLAGVGLVLAIAFLAFNLHFRKIKSIKLSSPRLNNMTVVGCMLVYSAVALLGLDHATLPPPVHFSVICTARVYLLSAGFSLAFGSMFAKTYRVHRIFVGSRSGLCKNKLLQDTQLISLICALLLIDGLIVTLWVAIDPMQRHLKNLTIEISAVDRGVVYQPQVEVCRSQHTNGWLGALYVYKGLLLIVGVFMAWETRHVKISALNDSQYIGISVYSVVITSGIVVVLANIISERATLAYVTITTLILISTTATLCLLFIPKLLAIKKKEDNSDPIIKSMGLKLECNTRRFVTDDKRELQYRVEIQNKVYRREMAALDKEINRLERLLLDSNPNSNTSSNTSLAQHRKMELTVIQETSGRKPSRDEYSRTASIGGGLPLLLLSVLPPVIPRASWPSAENAQLSMRRSVTFSSEPKLDENKCQPAIDLYNLRLLNKRQEENTGILARIRNLFGSRPASRKTSSASIAGNSGAGIAAALKLHMGMIAGLVPGAQKNNMVLSCNTLDVHTPINLRRESYAHSGPTINILTDEMYESGIGECSSRPKEEIFTYPGKPLVFQKQNPETEPKVNFQLPQKQRRPSMTHQISQPILSFKDRAKGSPRFPHKIVPTCSLSTLDDQGKSSAASSSNPLSAASLNPNNRRSSHQPQANKQRSRTSVGSVMGGRWKSMEDATLTLPGSRRGSGLLAVSYIPSNVYHSPRQSMTVNSPPCDVWATADFGIPLSQLDVEMEGQHAKYVRKDTSETSLS